MSSSSARTAKRRLLKLASLGLAGLLAGLLTGCTNSSTTNPYTNISSDSFRPSNSAHLPESLDATQIPSLRHPPSSRRLQIGTLHTFSQSMIPGGRNRS